MSRREPRGGVGGLLLDPAISHGMVCLNASHDNIFQRGQKPEHPEQSYYTVIGDTLLLSTTDLQTIPGSQVCFSVLFHPVYNSTTYRGFSSKGRGKYMTEFNMSRKSSRLHMCFMDRANTACDVWVNPVAWPDQRQQVEVINKKLLFSLCPHLS